MLIPLSIPLSQLLLCDLDNKYLLNQAYIDALAIMRDSLPVLIHLNIHLIDDLQTNGSFGRSLGLDHATLEELRLAIPCLLNEGTDDAMSFDMETDAAAIEINHRQFPKPGKPFPEDLAKALQVTQSQVEGFKQIIPELLPLKDRLLQLLEDYDKKKQRLIEVINKGSTPLTANEIQDIYSICDFIITGIAQTTKPYPAHLRLIYTALLTIRELSRNEVLVDFDNTIVFSSLLNSHAGSTATPNPALILTTIRTLIDRSQMG